MKFSARIIGFVIALSITFSWAFCAFSANKHAPKAQKIDITASPKYASLVVHFETGKVMHARNAGMIRHPASLTKMITLYLLFEALDKGKMHPNHKIKISKNAASQPRTNLALKAGELITAQEAIMGMIIRSANDVAYAVAEELGGSEEKFAQIMNAKAKSLGMKNTVFCNAHGLPHPGQVTTAHDMAILALALQRDHAKHFHLFSRTSFQFRNQIIKSHNHVVRKYKWATGLKTGFINASGFNIVTTTQSPSGKLVAVVLGGSTAASRDAHIITLIEASYRKLSSSSQRYSQPIQKGKIANYKLQKASMLIDNKDDKDQQYALKEHIPNAFGVIDSN